MVKLIAAAMVVAVATLAVLTGVAEAVNTPNNNCYETAGSMQTVCTNGEHHGWQTCRACRARGGTGCHRARD